ncbi:hypothetical protein [Mesorhizobium sp. B2-4-10]|nr:hypothetical protein [Mesorhizobium sp. B2-4-10]
MLGVEGWKIAWGVVFLIVEFVLIYGAVHHIINPENPELTRRQTVQ